MKLFMTGKISHKMPEGEEDEERQMDEQKHTVV